MINYILIDNFFPNVDAIREYALSLNYNKSSKETGWKGYRVRVDNGRITNHIKSKLIEKDSNFANLDLEIYFHYSIDNTKKEITNFDERRLHKDVTEWAGVIYLHPNPIINSGTTLHSDSGELIHNIENKYNRFIFYSGKILHGVLDTFGNSIEDGRLTITIFGSNNKKNKTLI